MRSPEVVKFSVADYYKMIEQGILIENHREEIIDGTLIRMPASSPHHAAMRSKLSALFFRRSEEEYAGVHINFPITLDEYNEPIPDFCFLRTDKEDSRERHPRADEVDLILEIADDTQDFHKTKIIPLYSQSCIPEVWLFDLERSEIERYSKPEDNVYSRLDRFKRGEAIGSISLPGISLPVDELFFPE